MRRQNWLAGAGRLMRGEGKERKKEGTKHPRGSKASKGFRV